MRTFIPLFVTLTGTCTIVAVVMILPLPAGAIPRPLTPCPYHSPALVHGECPVQIVAALPSFLKRGSDPQDSPTRVPGAIDIVSGAQGLYTAHPVPDSTSYSTTSTGGGPTSASSTPASQAPQHTLPSFIPEAQIAALVSLSSDPAVPTSSSTGLTTPQTTSTSHDMGDAKSEALEVSAGPQASGKDYSMIILPLLLVGLLCVAGFVWIPCRCRCRRVESQPEPEPELKLNLNLNPGPNHKAQPLSLSPSSSSSSSQSQPGPQPKPQPESQPESQSQFQPEPQPEPQSQSQPESQSQPQPESQSQPQSESQPESQSQPPLPLQPQPQPESQPKSQYQPQFRTKSKPKPKPSAPGLGAPGLGVRGLSLPALSVPWPTASRAPSSSSHISSTSSRRSAKSGGSVPSSTWGTSARSYFEPRASPEGPSASSTTAQVTLHSYNASEDSAIARGTDAQWW